MDILAQVTNGSLFRNGEMQWVIFFKENESVPSFVGLSVSDMGS